MKNFKFNVTIGVIFITCLIFAFSTGCKDDNNEDIGDPIGPGTPSYWFNIAIYNGSNDTVIYSVHGSNIESKHYLLKPDEYCLTFKWVPDSITIDNIETTGWEGNWRDHMYIDAFTLGDGYYNAIYVTFDYNLSLASAQSEDDLAGHYWGGANLGTICPGSHSENWLDVSWGSNKEHHTTGNYQLVNFYAIECADACDDDVRSIWIYTYSGNGSHLEEYPKLSYDDVYNSERKEVPFGSWVEKSDWKKATFSYSLYGYSMTVTCYDNEGNPVLNENFKWSECSDGYVDVDDDGKLHCR